MKIQLTAAAVLLAGTALLAQDPQAGGEFVIQGYFTPTIRDVQKVDIRPEMLDTILPDIPVTYRVIDAKADIPARVDSISPAKVKLEATQQRLYKGYVKGGFGLYTTPLGELYFDQTRSRNNSYGLHAKHFSSNGGLDDVGPSDYSFNSVDGYYKHLLRTHEVMGRLIYDRRRVSYFGYANNDSIQNLISTLAPPDDVLKQVYNDVGFAGRIRSLTTDSAKIAHDVGLEVHSYSNLTGSRETNVRLTADLAMHEGSETYGLGVLIDNNAYRGFVGGIIGDFAQNGTLTGFMPHVSTRGDKYLVKVGAGIYIDALGSTSFHFFPNAYASYSLFEDVLVPYVGLQGERSRNSFRSLTRQNPWLVGAPSLTNSSKLYDLYGGLRGSFSSRVAFDVRVSRSRVADMALFVNVPNQPFPNDPNIRLGDRMVPAYDRVDIFNVGGELRYHVKNTVDVTARLDVATYETRLQAEAWNLPPYELALGAVYDLRQKLIIKGEAQFLGRRKARGNEIVAPGILYETLELDGFLDLYLGLEYRYTKRLSVFLDISNLSASKYERWYRYPVQRGLVLGGATYAF